MKNLKMINGKSPVGNQDMTFEKWLWIELIGFDNQKEDFGVGEFIRRAGFVPDAISLLMFNPDFVHTHDGLDGDRNFPADFCSYWGRECSEERQRQAWTRYQLKGLVDQLHKNGVAAYFSVFDLFKSNEWIGRHPEIFHVRRNGERLNVICPWKRLADGEYYEDFFVDKTLKVAADYGFDGCHCADGYAHQRIPICEGDFSDDMVEQFVESTQVNLPEEMRGLAENDAERVRERADWIWRDRRLEWIRFYTDRVERFFKKLVHALHNASKRVVANTAWTKDPLEAIYRYGVDYRKLADAGVDAFIVESAACAVGVDGFEKVNSYRALYPFETALLLINACVPRTPLIFLNGIKDTTEQWDALRHCPHALEREIYELSNFYSYDDRGRLNRCASGLMACLADSIRPEEWRQLRTWWELGFSGKPSRIIGATLVWSDSAFENQLADFVKTRGWTTHRLVHHLLARNAPIRATVNIDHLETCKGAILVIHPHLYPEKEIRGILDYRNGPVIFIGAKTESLPQSEFQFEDVYPPDALACSVYGKGANPLDIAIEKDGAENLPVDIEGFSEPSGPHAMFYHDLHFRKVSESFLQCCADVIATCATPVRILANGESVRIAAFEDSEGKIRIMAGTDSHCAVSPQIDLGRIIRRLEVLTRFPGKAISPKGSEFSVHIPPRGAAFIRVETE